jgi:hypothetical protein
MSSAAQTNPSYGIGYADSADPGNPADLPSGTIEIMYTLLGDANLDGKVNGTDFSLMATNFNQAVTNGWDKGDFNYDGKVNGSDFVLLADNFNQFARQSAVSAADLTALDSFAAANGISLANVPEPACAGMIVMAGLGILLRRRRSSRSFEPKIALGGAGTASTRSVTFYEAGLVKRVMEFNLLSGFPGAALRAGLADSGPPSFQSTRVTLASGI